MSKASAPRFHQSNGSTARAEPSRRSGNTHGFCVTGGLPPIASEPTPSPRLWTTSPGANPARLCEHYHRAQKLAPKTGTFYLARNRNFLFGSDTIFSRMLARYVLTVLPLKCSSSAIWPIVFPEPIIRRTSNFRSDNIS